MNPQGNTMQPPAPLARKAERVLMTIAAAYNVIMASITLFMFTSWFKGQAYDLLEHNGLLKTAIPRWTTPRRWWASTRCWC